MIDIDIKVQGILENGTDSGNSRDEPGGSTYNLWNDDSLGTAKTGTQYMSLNSVRVAQLMAWG